MKPTGAPGRAPPGTVKEEGDGRKPLRRPFILSDKNDDVGMVVQFKARLAGEGSGVSERGGGHVRTVTGIQKEATWRNRPPNVDKRPHLPRKIREKTPTMFKAPPIPSTETGDKATDSGISLAETLKSELLRRFESFGPNQICKKNPHCPGQKGMEL